MNEVAEPAGRAAHSWPVEPAGPEGRVERRLAAVIGDPVGHSHSPAIHNAAFATTGLDWDFVALTTPAGQGAAALDAMREFGLGGMSVTMPLKGEVAAAADTSDEVVRVLGAANCIVPAAGGMLHAANTDVGGFLAALEADAGVTPEGRRVALLGAGGAAKAVAWAVARAGAADVAVINRTRSRAEEVAVLAGAVGRAGAAEDVSEADLVINATSVGMGADGSMPCDPALLHDAQVAVDLIYVPLETQWLTDLRRRGIQAHNGMSMLVYQAAEAFELWTGVPAPVEVMRRAAASAHVA